MTKKTLSGVAIGVNECTFCGTQSITVELAGDSDTPNQTFTATTFAGNFWRSWEEKSELIDVTGSNITLMCSATAQFDVGLDNVRLERVPEPGTFLLLGFGLAGLAGLSWRQHRRT